MKHSNGPRRRAITLVRESFRDRQLRLIVFGTSVAIIAIPAGIDFWLTKLRVRQYQWLNGFTIGFLLAAFLGMITYLILIVSGAHAYMVGGLAEDWTHKELQKLGKDWHLLRNVSFEEGWGDASYQVDIDHVAIGPYGVLALETKFSSGNIDLGAKNVGRLVVEASDQAQRNAGRVKALLNRDAPWAPVRPVVVYWGPKVRGPKGGVRRLDEVRVVLGAEADQWMPRLDQRRELTDDQILAVSQKFRQFMGDS